jgi:Ubiquitin family
MAAFANLAEFDVLSMSGSEAPKQQKKRNKGKAKHAALATARATAAVAAAFTAPATPITGKPTAAAKGGGAQKPVRFVHVHCPLGVKTTLHVQPFFTVETLQQALQSLKKWQSADTRLIYNSNKHLMSGRTLEDYGIANNANLYMIQVQQGSIQVCVKRDDAPELYVDTLASNTIADLKGLLKDKTGIDADHQVLMYRSITLMNDQTLQQSRISNQAELHLKRAENNAAPIILAVRNFTAYGNGSGSAVRAPVCDVRGGVGPLSSGDWLEATLTVPATASYEFAYVLSDTGKPVEEKVQVEAPPATSHSLQQQRQLAYRYGQPCEHCKYQHNHASATQCGSCGKNPVKQTVVVTNILPTELSLELYTAKGSQQLAALTLPDLTRSTVACSISPSALQSVYGRDYAAMNTLSEAATRKQIVYKAGGAPTRLTAGASLVRILIKSGNGVRINSILLTPCAAA